VVYKFIQGLGYKVKGESSSQSRYLYINTENTKIMEKIIKRAFIDALGTTAFIILVVLFIFSLQVLSSKEDIIIIPIAMLLLFVTSAAITGFLVFGKPIMLYIDGKKTEAISLLNYTIGILFLITIIVFIFLIAYDSLF
jgi:hypothetical protein